MGSTMNREITIATAYDTDELLTLYKSQHGREYCPWEEDYPSRDTIEFDLSRDALFVMKEDGKIIAAISIDLDPDVDALACWTPDLQPGGETSRLAVAIDYQNQGIARQMLLYAMGVLRERGYKSIHFLVNRLNVKALKSYDKLEFNNVGETFMYNQPFFCYEKALV